MFYDFLLHVIWTHHTTSSTLQNPGPAPSCRISSPCQKGYEVYIKGSNGRTIALSQERSFNEDKATKNGSNISGHSMSITDEDCKSLCISACVRVCSESQIDSQTIAGCVGIRTSLTHFSRTVLNTWRLCVIPKTHQDFCRTTLFWSKATQTLEQKLSTSTTRRVERPNHFCCQNPVGPKSWGKRWIEMDRDGRRKRIGDKGDKGDEKKKDW